MLECAVLYNYNETAKSGDGGAVVALLTSDIVCGYG